MTFTLFPDRRKVQLLTVQYRQGSTIELPSPAFAAQAQLAAIDCSLSTSSRPLVTYTVRITRRLRKEIGDRLKRSRDVEKLRWLKVPG